MREKKGMDNIMKKLFTVLLLLACVTILTLVAAATGPVVFVDGTAAAGGDGTLETPYNKLSTAVTALKTTGGTVVLTGRCTASTLALAIHSQPITYTSVYDDVDYAESNGACLSLGGRLILGGVSVFRDITIEANSTTTTPAGPAIYAYGFQTTFDTGVVCTNPLGEKYYPILFAGGYSNNGGRDPDLTVRSGTWRAIYAGNGNGNFTGNSTVNFEGGRVLMTLCGGNQTVGNFTGNTTLNISGGTVEYDASGFGVIGASLGDGTNARTFTGDIAINVSGDADIRSNLLGATRNNSLVTVNGDITITITGGSFARSIFGGGYGGVTTGVNGIRLFLTGAPSFTGTYGSYVVCGGAYGGTVDGDVTVDVNVSTAFVGSILGGGYSGNVTGHSAVILRNGTVPVTLSAGSRTGTVGSASVEMYGGRVGFYSSSESYGVTGNGRNATSGTVSGLSTILIAGGEVAGEVALNPARIGSGSVTLRGGSIGSVADTAAVDLSAGGHLQVGGSLAVSNFVGGGTLTLSAAGAMTAESASGTTAFAVQGTPENNKTYITVADADSAAVFNYTPLDDEVLVRTAGADVRYTIEYPEKVELAVSNAEATIDGAGRGNVRIVTAASVPESSSVTGYGAYFIPYAVFTGDGEALTRAARIYTAGALGDGETFSADLLQIPSEFAGETVLAIAFCIVGGEEVTTAQYTFSVSGLIG